MVGLAEIAGRTVITVLGGTVMVSLSLGLPCSTRASTSMRSRWGTESSARKSACCESADRAQPRAATQALPQVRS